MLHITNGDSALEGLRAAGMQGELVPWRDVLHEGPVPDTPGLPEIRAQFLADGETSVERVVQMFAERDAALRQQHDEVVLWFEHDLYDQLQLIQILAWYHDNPAPNLTLINPAAYLGPMRPAQLAALFPTRTAVSQAQLELASRAWKAFTAPSPEKLNYLRGPELPHLNAAIERLLTEYPSTYNGLSRTDDLIMRAVASGYRSPHAVFRAVNRVEEPFFLGDTTVFARISKLEGLLEGPPFKLTDLGSKVLAGKADAIRDRGGIDRWIGGVHLKGEDASWRYDPATGAVVQSR